MNLREQFEKETGESATDWRMGSPVLHPHYVQWLEKRNKEQVEVLIDARDTFKIMNEYIIHDTDIYNNKTLPDRIKEIEEQLKKSE